MPTMEITAAMVKELRDKTGAGMMECKAALAEANGNMEEAITILRKRGLAQAETAGGDKDRDKNGDQGDEGRRQARPARRAVAEAATAPAVV